MITVLALRLLQPVPELWLVCLLLTIQVELLRLLQVQPTLLSCFFMLISASCFYQVVLFHDDDDDDADDDDADDDDDDDDGDDDSDD